MGQHRAVATQRTLLAGPGSAKFIGRVGGLAVALGVGAAVAGGAGIASADDSPGGDPGGTSGGVHSPAADGPASTGAEGAASTGSSHGAKVATPRAQRLPRTPPHTGTRHHPRSRHDDDGATGGAHRDTLRRGVQHDDTTVTPSAGSGGTAKTAPPPDDAATSTGKHARRQNADDSTVTVRTEKVSAITTVAPRDTLEQPARPVAAVVTGLLAAVGVDSPSGADTGDVPVTPAQLVLGALQLIRREIDHAVVDARQVRFTTVAARSLVTTAAVAPQPTDVASTPYGALGQWMLKSNGQISNYGGATSGGKALLEPVNVIIVDPTSTSPEEATRKLNAAMKAAGFPAGVPHTTGYQGLINGTIYGQQPSGILQAFSNNGSPQDHGRVFGAAPAQDGQGYVWTGAFSTEGSSHQYLSFDDARDDLAAALVASGAATRLDDVDMGNAGVTGDHDGYAVVLALAPSPPNLPPTATVTQNKPSASSGKVTGKVTAVDPEKDKLTYTGMTTAKGTVTVTSTGSFTYTPTAAARHAAAATTATTTDTFAITVTDAAGGVTPVPVTVTVVPKNTAPSTKVTVGKADPLAGTVIGKVAVTDADADVATFGSPHPVSGPVAFDDDGTFTYQPSDAARQQARARGAIGSETFAVTVDDGHGGRKTVNVTVPIAPTDQAPIAGALEFTPAAGTGVVKGSLRATDPDLDAFSFSGSTKTLHGTVSVSSKGTFTYTPTAAARRAAAADPTLTDVFRIYVTDQFGAVTAQDVEVPILGKA